MALGHTLSRKRKKLKQKNIYIYIYIYLYIYIKVTYLITILLKFLGNETILLTF